jgi:hypothetical protein
LSYINEYVPVADIESRGLYQLWNRFHPFDPMPHVGHRLSWTVGRDTDSFLMRVRIGREEEERKHTWVFRFSGCEYEVHLEYCGGSGRTDVSPFCIDWRLLRLIPTPMNSEETQLLHSSLAAALATFGYWGIEHQIPNTIVKLHI